MIKIMICRCNINKLQTYVEYFETPKFNDCPHREPHQYVVATCPYSLCNTLLHARNYFSSTNCFCFAENKNYICSFYTYFQMQLRNAILKICIQESDVEKLDFELFLIKTHLYKKIKASPFFTFDEENEKINVYLNNRFAVIFLMI